MGISQDLPFERLPKFVTATGLTLLVTSASFGYSRYVVQQEEKIQIADATRAMNAAMDSIDVLKEQHDQAAIFVNFHGCTNAARTAEALNRCDTQEKEELAKWEKEVADNRADYRKGVEDVDARASHYDHGVHIYIFQMVLAILGTLVGAVLAGYGLRQWKISEQASQAESNR